MKKKVAIYLRVSTPRQAKQDVSIPDQRKQANDYCRARGWYVEKEYVEAGKTATDDNRPEFQKMISEACSESHPFDIILVYSFSRFFRDAIDSGVYRRKLEKHKVSVESMTQDFGEGHDGELLKNIIAAVDEHASKENGKNTRSRMIENAKQGFWNGAIPPFGYKVVTAEIRGEKEKKKLQIEPSEARIVRKIYKQYSQGYGVKGITTWLNQNGYLKRNKKLFYTANVYTILSKSTYCGKHYFNTRYPKTRELKPRDEWVEINCPAIISQEQFDSVQTLLRQKRPAVTAPHSNSACTLLNGLAKCATCNSSYMIMTSGKNEKYRYYKPSRRRICDNSACTCKNIPMQFLDDLVMNEIANKILDPEFLTEIISELSENNKKHSQPTKTEIKVLKSELQETQNRLDNLYNSLAEGKISDFESLNEFIDKENARKIELVRQIRIKKGQLNNSYSFSKGQIAMFSKKLKNDLINGSMEFRKKRLKEFVNQIEINDEGILIKASKNILVDTMVNMKRGSSREVRTFVREWHAVQDKDTNLDIIVELPEKYKKKKK